MFPPPPESFSGFTPVIANSDYASLNFVSKQAELDDVSQEVRNGFSVLPPDVGYSLFAEYQPSTESQLSSLLNNLLTREFALAEMAQGNNIDKSWLSSEVVPHITSDDPWNKGFDKGTNDGFNANSDDDASYDFGM